MKLMAATFTAMICLLPLSPALSETSETPADVEAAGIQLALAANCRANYGQQEVFDAALSEFVAVAKAKLGDELTEEMVTEVRQGMSEVEAEPGGNPFLRGFCDMLKEELLPGSE